MVVPCPFINENLLKSHSVKFLKGYQKVVVSKDCLNRHYRWDYCLAYIQIHRLISYLNSLI